jgi:hypothetical protein
VYATVTISSSKESVIACSITTGIGILDLQTCGLVKLVNMRTIRAVPIFTVITSDPDEPRRVSPGGIQQAQLLPSIPAAPTVRRAHGIILDWKIAFRSSLAKLFFVPHRVLDNVL